MSDEEKEWILPASIPFTELKGRDLEECLYWLLDAMGAKDLEWRAGGSGGGASDGGRDLEAHFYTPTADQEMEPQVWWVECKGRSGTVEPGEVKSAVVNAQARGDLDYVVIATNTQFSNPTRDWVKEWQKKNPRPKVKLWDSSHLERLLSRHPDVVLRLFSEALSLDGQFQALESRFWNKLEFVSSPTLKKLWKARAEAEFTSLGLFALIANEFANGSITHRPWGAVLDAASLVQVLHMGLVNVPYLMMRASKAGVEQTPLNRAFAYLILCAIDQLPAENVAELVIDSITRGKPDEFPEDVQAYLLMPIADQLLSEIQDVCSADCTRVSAFSRMTLTEGKDEIDEYWKRLEPAGSEEVEEPGRHLRLERQDAPCQVGFAVNKDHDCPLFHIEPSVQNFGELLAILKRVAAHRKAQAAEKREADAARRQARAG
ncbi:restriction endonuclease [Rhizobium sp. WYCCWR 11128]|uniref:restriction endonuclease n=1 Tax=Rhizobium sp. WYCCWR 11128 TaxID=2749832 RepID=UPI0015D271CF|nr:restriction endonuclease [Rhizobium sp. WYCCWR 11128]NYT32119.1 restriction endonuclease [Rhizobium sp. WYCCWR 11128]